MSPDEAVALAAKVGIKAAESLGKTPVGAACVAAAVAGNAAAELKQPRQRMKQKPESQRWQELRSVQQQKLRPRPEQPPRMQAEQIARLLPVQPPRPQLRCQ